MYEVIKVLAGRARDLERHLDRLERSLAALDIAPPMTRRALESVLFETLRRNRLADALLYLQITRGARRAIICSRSGPAPRWWSQRAGRSFPASASARKGSA